MKKIAIGILVLVVLVGLTLGYAAMNASYLIAYLKPELERSLGKALKTKVEVGKVNLSVFPETNFVLEQISIGEAVGSSRVDLQACKLEYSIVSPK